MGIDFDVPVLDARWSDWTLAALALALPLGFELLAGGGERAEVAAGGARARAYVWRTTIRFQLAAAGLVLANHLARGRELATLGLGPELRPDPFALVLAGAVALALLVQLLLAGRLARAGKRPSGIESFADFLPHERRELPAFWRLALVAGVCEELVARGFLIALLAAVLPGALAVVAAAALFGLAHLYQGWRGVASTALAGALLGVLYVRLGSLWIPMALHAWADLAQGTLVQRLLEAAPAEEGSAEKG